MVSNAWDEDITQVEVSLTRPDGNGFSWLRVTDNSPTGWANLSHSHTMFAESVKKGKSEKRGRFNAGEKDVLALAIEAKFTTVYGQVLFNEDGTRTEGAETRDVGSEFVGKFRLTVEEYEHICNQAKMLIPPKGIATLFNGSPMSYRKPCGSFTECSDSAGGQGRRHAEHGTQGYGLPLQAAPRRGRHDLRDGNSNRRTG